MQEMNNETDPITEQFNKGGLIAYPTEAVFGLGCDPDNQQAVESLLRLKQRDISKGLILIAKTYSQVLPYVKDSAIPMHKRTEIFSSWPGPVTWLLPKSDEAPYWITGDSEMVAVRITGHATVQHLCEQFDKPIVSTSANVSGQPPARSKQEVQHQFQDKVLVVDGEIGGNEKPSQIRHSITGEVIRA